MRDEDKDEDEEEEIIIIYYIWIYLYCYYVYYITIILYTNHEYYKKKYVHISRSLPSVLYIGWQNVGKIEIYFSTIYKYR